MYIGDVNSEEAPHNMLWEVLFNSIDEYTQGHGKSIGIWMDAASRINIVSDFGRGIPNEMNEEEGKSHLEIAHSYFHSGGKFDDDSYKFTSGLHGIGLTVLNALSSFLIVVSQRNTLIRYIVFNRGEKISEKSYRGSFKITGTWTMFRIDSKYFSFPELKTNLVKNKLRSACYLYPEINFRLTTVNSSGVIKKILLKGRDFQDIVIDDAKKFNAGKSLISKPIVIQNSSDKGGVRMVFDWYTRGGSIRSFSNGLEQISGGTHVNAMIKEIRNVLLQYQNLSLSTVREGLYAAVEVRIIDPQYSSQTKERLTSTSVNLLIRDAFKNNLDTFTLESKWLSRLAEYLKKIEKKKEDIMEGKTILADEMMGGVSGALPGKLMACRSRDTEINELFIAEGDSASATAKAARDSLFQAVLPIRGKLINVERASLKKAMNFDAIKNIVVSIGAGVASTFNESKIRYGKVIIMTDADCDGYQIRALIIALFYKYMREYVESGRVYFANPPLFRLKIGKKISFYINRRALESRLIKESGIGDEWVLKVYRAISRRYGWSISSLDMVEKYCDSNFDDCCIHNWNGNTLIRYGFESFPQYVRLDHIIKYLIAWLRVYLLQNRPLSWIRHAIDISRFDVYRFKGLGQMNWDELWDKVMNPKTRYIVQVTIEDAEMAQKLYERYMGSDPRWRKILISQSNLTLYDLDV